MSWLADIFGGGTAIKKAIQDGAVIVDLRNAYEYDQGHIPRSLNIPVDRLRANIDRLRDLAKPVIVCCDNSGDCWRAADILRNAGVQRVINGGDWRSVLRYS